MLAYRWSDSQTHVHSQWHVSWIPKHVAQRLCRLWISRTLEEACDTPSECQHSLHENCDTSSDSGLMLYVACGTSPESQRKLHNVCTSSEFVRTLRTASVVRLLNLNARYTKPTEHLMNTSGRSTTSPVCLLNPYARWTKPMVLCWIPALGVWSPFISWRIACLS